MFLFEQLYVKLQPYTTLTSQNRSTYQHLYQTEANPGGYLIEGKVYKVLALNDRGGGTWQALLATERGRFQWVDFEILLNGQAELVSEKLETPADTPANDESTETNEETPKEAPKRGRPPKASQD